MSAVVVLATGGTISARRDASGAAVATDGGQALLGQPVPGLSVEVEDVFTSDSSSLTIPMMAQLAARASAAVRRDDVDGVVITHGTDTLEESALLLDLVLGTDKPIVLTGAMHDRDSPTPDGPVNLRDALRVAADPDSRGRGVLIAFAGQIYAALGVRKMSTTAASAFDAPDAGPIGVVLKEVVSYSAPPAERWPTWEGDLSLIGSKRVDVVATYPGVDSYAIEAAVAAGAEGLVLEAMGAGNSNRHIAAAVAETAASGVVVLVTTRVPFGPVSPSYGGGGGGADLAAAGAVMGGNLRSGQGRIALSVLLSSPGARRLPGVLTNAYRRLLG